MQVPIVKLTDAETEVKVDISFNMDHNKSNGVESAMLIKVCCPRHVQSSCFSFVRACIDTYTRVVLCQLYSLFRVQKNGSLKKRFLLK